jgi:hypothetical protein
MVLGFAALTSRATSKDITTISNPPSRPISLVEDGQFGRAQLPSAVQETGSGPKTTMAAVLEDELEARPSYLHVRERV